MVIPAAAKQCSVFNSFSSLFVKFDSCQTVTGAQVRARCSWSQVSAFQHYGNIPLASSPSQSLYSPPPPPPPPQPYPHFGYNPSSLPLLPYALDSLLPPFPPSSRPRPSGPFHFGSPSTAYTGPCHSLSPPCLFRPSSVLQTSVDPGLLIPSAFYTPLPSTTPPLPPST